MKLTKVTAYKSNDGCIWETEKEAIQQNIDDCFGKTEITHADDYTTIKDKILNWMKEHLRDVKYILANINII